MSRLCIDGGEMTDDQRDAMCNLGESLGLTGGQAEDLIDEYLERVSVMPAQSMPRPVGTATTTPVRTAPATATKKPVAPAPAPVPAPAVRRQALVITPLLRAQEKEKYRNFRNVLGGEMLLITTGSFLMGSGAPGALANEQPVTPVTLTRFYMSRFPITNAQYERFDPSHVSKRAPWANEQHPVIYVTARDAERFCEWLSQTERKKYRLPTEAEWSTRPEASRRESFHGEILSTPGTTRISLTPRRPFPGETRGSTMAGRRRRPLAFFRAERAHLGSRIWQGTYSSGLSTASKRTRERKSPTPRGPKQSSQRVYRGGSWKSRTTSLRSTARAFNSPDYSSNDVGFRIICECE
jgi:formylglycine-generating enzyme required for sulfatase activity